MCFWRIILLCCLLGWYSEGVARGGKSEFLAHKAVTLAQADICFTDSIRIWGFGALHGSARTEEVELHLLSKLLSQRDSVWYFPETDFCTAHYFEEYLRTGNDSLLRQLVMCYGRRVPQERTVEVYEKWSRLRKLVQGKCLRVVGVDPVCSPAFALRYLLDSVRKEDWRFRKPLLRLLENAGEVSAEEYKPLIEDVQADYDRDGAYYAANVADTASYGYVIRDLRRLGEKREQAMLRNYLELDARYDFRNRPQFVRMGVGHILKEQQDGWRSFFARLVEQGVYRRQDIYTIQGFLMRSRVVWDEKFDDKGNYAGCTTKGGWGVSDCWRERFRGIRQLKRCRMGDMTFYDLHGADSPYARPACLDLVVCRRLFGRSEQCPSGTSSLDYLDAAVLICNSKASRPIYELNNK